MTNKRERRFLESDVKLETREANQPRITGYATRFMPVQSVPLGNFVEQLDPHCFDNFLSANPPGDVVALFNHDENQPLGRLSAGNLKIGVDDVGLWYEVSPIPDTSYARDLVENLRMGIVKSSSFGFYADDEEWTKDSEGRNVRTIKAARLFDVSPVLNPAYPDATSQLRALFPDGTDHLNIRNETEDEARYRVYQHLMLDSLRLTARRTR